MIAAGLINGQSYCIPKTSYDLNVISRDRQYTSFILSAIAEIKRVWENMFL